MGVESPQINLLRCENIHSCLNSTCFEFPLEVCLYVFSFFSDYAGSPRSSSHDKKADN